MATDSKIINTKLYQLVSKALSTRDNQFRKNIAKFIQDRHEYIFDIGPYDRIFFNQTDVDNMFKSLGILEAEVAGIMKDTYYWNIPINPLQLRGSMQGK